MNKKIVKIIGIILSVVLLVNIIDMNKENNVRKEDTFCVVCGAALDTVCAQYLLDEDGIYYINSWESEAATAYSNMYAKYDVDFEHINPETGAPCRVRRQTTSVSPKGYKSYAETHQFPIITLTSSKIAYTGGNVEPSFKVTFNGKEIARSNYDYYYSYNFSDSARRAYSYCSQMSKSIKEPGTYYLYVMFNPNNTCGPNGTTFLGRIDAQFEIVNGSVDPDSGSGGGTNPSGGVTPSGGGTNPSGSSSTRKNTIITEDGKTYYLDSNGKKVTNSVKKVGHVYYYFGSTGAREYPENEYRKGVWFNSVGEGSTTFCNGQWKKDATGWWYQDGNYYPRSQWLKIDGDWYYFISSGYMDYSEYRDGCWLDDKGRWDKSYQNGRWIKNSVGWYYDDAGWYPANEWLWIDGVNYHFNSKGYMD